MAQIPPMAQAVMNTLPGASGAPPLGAQPMGAPLPPIGGPPRSPIPSATGAPPPTGIGATPTGDVDPHTAISSAILWAKTVKDHYPQAAQQIDACIALLQSLANPRLPTPAGPNPASSMPAPPSPMPAPPEPTAAMPEPPAP